VISEVTNVEKEFEMFKTLKFKGKVKRRGPEPRQRTRYILSTACSISLSNGGSS
jgi:hypothetical protein